MHFDSIPLIVTALLVLIGAGLFGVGLYLMHFKGESRQGARRAWLFITLGIVLGVAAVLTLVLTAMKTGLLG
jgi:hypothetical protein